MDPDTQLLSFAVLAVVTVVLLTGLLIAAWIFTVRHRAWKDDARPAPEVKAVTLRIQRDLFDPRYRAERLAELRATKSAPEAPRLPPETWTWREAEKGVADWLSANGERNVRVGAGSHDGGVDVETDRWVVQVKHWSAKVGAADVRQIFGVATARGKHAMVVTMNGFTADARMFARDAGVALYLYRTGQFQPLE